MKLENFKNEKFILSSEEMGKLVGGEAVKTGSAAGTLKGNDSPLPWNYSYSSDCTTTVDGKSSTTYYQEDYDSCVERPENRCDDPCDIAKKNSYTMPSAMVTNAQPISLLSAVSSQMAFAAPAASANSISPMLLM